MRRFEVLVSRDAIVVDQIKTRWYLVERAVNMLCRLTRCHACWVWPVRPLLNRAINTHESFRIPADEAQIRAFIAWARFDIANDLWEDLEDEPKFAREPDVRIPGIPGVDDEDWEWPSPVTMMPSVVVEPPIP